MPSIYHQILTKNKACNHNISFKVIVIFKDAQNLKLHTFNGGNFSFFIQIFISKTSSLNSSTTPPSWIFQILNFM